jgi:hypothetical protein
MQNVALGVSALFIPAAFLVFVLLKFGNGAILSFNWVAHARMWHMQKEQFSRWHTVYFWVASIPCLYVLANWPFFYFEAFPRLNVFGLEVYALRVFSRWVFPTPLTVAAPAPVNIGYVLVYLPAFFALCDLAARMIFPHSAITKTFHRVLKAKPEFENAHMAITQTSFNSLVIIHDAFLRNEWFAMHRHELGAATHCTIENVTRVNDSSVCLMFRENKLADNFAARARWEKPVRESFTYFMTFLDETGKVCKIGMAYEPATVLRAAKRFRLTQAQIVLTIPSNILPETKAHNMFEDLKKDGEVFYYQGHLQEFVESQLVARETS